MQAQPGLDRLIEHELGILMAAARQRHHERPRATEATTFGIEELAAEPEVDLGFLARRHLDPERRAHRGGCHAAQEPLDRGVAAREAVLLDQELPDGLPFDPAFVQHQDPLAPRLDERLLVRGPLGRAWLQQCRQGRGVGQRAAVEHPVAGGPDAVAGHRVTADVQVAGDASVRLAQLQTANNLANVGHRTPPSRHGSPPGGDGLLREGFPVVKRKRKKSGHAPPGGSTWPPLGGSVWVTLAGSRWATPGGSASPTPVAQYGATADTSRPPR